MQKMSSYDLSTPWNIAQSTSPKSFFKTQEVRFWILSAIRLLKTSQANSPKWLFWCQGFTLWDGVTIRHLETSFLRIQQSRFLGRPDGRLLVPRAICLRGTSRKGLHPSGFFRCSGCRKWIRMSEALKHCFLDFTKRVFKTPGRHITRSQSHWPN
jgi:hypothetical protein